VQAGQLCYLSSQPPTLSVPSIAKQQKWKPARSRIPHLSQFQIMERDKRMRNAKPVNSVLLLLPRRITKSKALSNTAATSSARNSTRIWRVSRLLLFRTKTWVYCLVGSASVEPFFFVEWLFQALRGSTCYRRQSGGGRQYKVRLRPTDLDDRRMNANRRSRSR
jgi:hypothetical protein